MRLKVGAAVLSGDLGPSALDDRRSESGPPSHRSWRRRVGMKDAHGIADQPPSSSRHSWWQCADHSVVHRKNVQPVFQMQRAECQTPVAVSLVRESAVIWAQIPS